MNLSPATVGFIRGLLYALGGTLCAYLAANLGASGILPPTIASIVVGLAGAAEHYLTQ